MVIGSCGGNHLFHLMLLDRPVTLSMLILALVLFGGLALRQLRMDFLPSVAYPTLTIRTSWEGASAELIESELTEVIEAHLGSIPGIKELHSLSTRGMSHIKVEFEWGQSMDMRYLNVREKLDQLRSQLPEQVQRSQVYRFNPADAPMAELLIYENKSQAQTQGKASKPGFSLHQWIDQVLCRQLEQLDGVAFTDRITIAEPELRIEVNRQELARHALDLKDLQQRLASYASPSYSGEIRDGWYRYTLTVTQTVQNLEELKAIPLKRLPSGQLLYLRDVARVKWVNPVEERFLMKGSQTVSTVLVKKEADADQMEVQEQIHFLLDRLRAEYPEIRIELINDSASVVRYVIQNLHFTLWMGALCSFLILYVFLKDPQLPLVIGISIPLCLLTTFLAMYLLDLELNVISMSGLILGVGMFVDNGIVVLEHIHNHHKRGLPMRQAVLQGTKEIRLPVMASTLTTISVYFPLVLLPGAEGVWFKDQAWTLTLSLLSSWAITMLFVPGLVLLRSDRLLSNFSMTSQVPPKNWFSNPIEQWGHRYETSLQKVLKLSIVQGVALIFLLMLLLVGVYRALPKALLPTMDSEHLNLRVVLPAYYDPASVRQAALQSHHFLSAYVPDSQIVIRRGHDEPNGIRTATTTAPEILIQVPQLNRGKNLPEGSSPRQIASISTDSLLTRFRKQHREWNITLDVEAHQEWRWFETESEPIRLYLVGDDVVGDHRKELQDKSRQLAELLKKYGKDLKLTLAQSDQVWGYDLRINPEGLQRYGMEEARLIDWLKTQGGGQVQTLALDHKETALRWFTQHSSTTLGELHVPTPYGEIPLAQLVDITIEQQTAGLERMHQASVLSLNTQLSLADWYFDEHLLRTYLNSASRELGVPILIDGYALEVKAMLQRMTRLLLLSVILIYVILAIQFEHLFYPLIILFSVPCAWLGGLLALWLGQGSLNVLSFLSALLLAGLAVNDAILKVDVIKSRLFEQPNVAFAISESGRLRFRPVIMTTVTTVLGLIPMLIPAGMGYEFRKPFGLVLIGGMTSSTVLTLYLIPLWCKWTYDLGLLKPARHQKTEGISTYEHSTHAQ